MSNYNNYETFGSIGVSLNYDPHFTPHRADRAIYIRPVGATVTLGALDLADAKNLHAHLGKLIDQIEAGIKAQKSKLPTAFGSVVELSDGEKLVFHGDAWENESVYLKTSELSERDYTVLRDGI